MTIYLISYLLLFIMAFIVRKSRWYVWLVCVFFSVLVGFRGLTVGADTLEYYQMYESIGYNGYSGYPELIYGYLCFYAYRWGLSFGWFQAILLFVALLALSRHVIKYSPHHGQSMFFLYTLYLIFYTMNIYREMIACFLMLSIYPLLLNRNKINVILYVLLTIMISGIHGSALYFLGLLFIPYLKFSNLTITISIVVSLLLGLILPYDLIEIVGSRYGSLQYSDANASHNIFQALGLCFFWILEFVLISILTTPAFKKTIYYKILFLGVIVSDLLLKQGLGIRVFLYFNVMQVVTIPLAVQEYSKNKSVNQLSMMAVISIFFFVFLLINSASVVPYEFNW